MIIKKTAYKNRQLKRASIILFGKDPCRFYPGAFVKIGRFVKDDADLRYQDVEERTARNDLNELVENKLLMKIGETKSVKYAFAE